MAVLDMPSIIRGLRRYGLGNINGRAEAGPDAQRVGDGLGIENIRRGFLFVETVGPSNETVSSATFVGLSTRCRGSLYLSGRPLRIQVAAAVNAGVSGAMCLDVALRGKNVSPTPHGLPGTYTQYSGVHSVSGFYVVQAPAAGIAELEVLARRDNTDGTIHMTGNGRVTLLAEEI